jgi:hypothetical protein
VSGDDNDFQRAEQVKFIQKMKDDGQNSSGSVYESNKFSGDDDDVVMTPVGVQSSREAGTGQE